MAFLEAFGMSPIAVHGVLCLHVMPLPPPLSPPRTSFRRPPSQCISIRPETWALSCSCPAVKQPVWSIPHIPVPRTRAACLGGALAAAQLHCLAKERHQIDQVRSGRLSYLGTTGGASHHGHHGSYLLPAWISELVRLKALPSPVSTIVGLTLSSPRNTRYRAMAENKVSLHSFTQWIVNSRLHIFI
jgi:hypothetical protein